MTSQNWKSRLVRASVGAVCLAVASGMAMTAAAQEQRFSDEQIAQIEERVAATRERLQLTPEQQAALEPILTASVEQRLAVLQSYGFSGEERPKLSFRQKLSLRKEMQAIREKTESEVAGVLSEEQLAEYKKIQDENREQLRARLQNRNS